MRYTIANAEDDVLVDQEFDRLDWLIREGRLDEAREACLRIVDAPDVSARNASWACLLLGAVDLARQNYEEALRHFKAIQIVSAPLRPRLAASTAKALIMLGHGEEAHQQIQTLLSESPESWYSWEVLGVWQKAQGDEEGAWKSLLRAAELNSRESSIISNLIALGLTPNRCRELTVALEKHLIMEPHNMGVRMCLVSCLLSMGEIQRARDEARRVVAFGPFVELPSDLLASMQHILNQLEQV